MRIATLILGLILFGFCMLFALAFIGAGSIGSNLSFATSAVSNDGQDAVYLGWAIFGVGILSAFGAAFSLNMPRISTYFFAIAFISSVVATVIIGLHNGSIGPFFIRMLPFAAASLLFAAFSYFGDLELRKEKG